MYQVYASRQAPLANSNILFDTDATIIVASADWNSRKPTIYVKVGSLAGFRSQITTCIAIGFNAGYANQGEAALGIGTSTIICKQGIDSVDVSNERMHETAKSAHVKSHHLEQFF